MYPFWLWSIAYYGLRPILIHDVILSTYDTPQIQELHVNVTLSKRYHAHKSEGKKVAIVTDNYETDVEKDNDIGSRSTHVGTLAWPQDPSVFLPVTTQNLVPTTGCGRVPLVVELSQRWELEPQHHRIISTKRNWFSGKILRCHRGALGSIPRLRSESAKLVASLFARSSVLAVVSWTPSSAILEQPPCWCSGANPS